jgi:hypothetical protein
MRATIGKSKPYLAIPESEARPEPVAPILTFDEFLRLCYAAGVRDDDSITFIDWERGKGVKVRALSGGIAVVSA